MIKHSFPIKNLGHLGSMLNWYQSTFSRLADYDIHSRNNIFQPQAEIVFQDRSELSLFLLKFGQR